MGMLLTLQAYQTYVSSVLAQLEPLPPTFDDTERWALQALFPGPTAWILPQCLKDAGHIHVLVLLVDLVAVATAGNARATRFESAQHGVHARTVRLLHDSSQG